MTESRQARVAAESEMDAVREALRAGNDGKARVCARRAAGVVLRPYYAGTGATGGGPDAMNLLLRASDDRSLPDRVRVAALRLTTKVAERDSRPFSEDPAGDARIIVDWFLAAMEGSSRE